MARMKISISSSRVKSLSGSVGRRFKTAMLGALIGGLDQAAMKVAIAFHDATPIDTGRARRGWVIERSKAGHTYYIHNDVPYIPYLDTDPGHSSQAPHGITKLALQRLRARGIVA